MNFHNLKPTLVVFIILFFTYPDLSLAQEKQKKIRLGIYGGGNISKLYSQDLYKLVENPFVETYKYTGSYNFGFYADYALTKAIYIEGGLNYISKNSNSSAPKEILKLTRGYYDAITSYKNFYKYYYREFNHRSTALQIPLSINFILFQKNQFKSSIYIGFFWENVLSHKLEVVDSYTWMPDTPPQSILDEVKTVENKYIPSYSKSESAYVKYGVGLIYGVGLSYKKFGIDIGMNNPIRAYNSVQYSNRSLTLNIKYRLR